MRIAGAGRQVIAPAGLFFADLQVVPAIRDPKQIALALDQPATLQHHQQCVEQTCVFREYARAEQQRGFVGSIAHQIENAHLLEGRLKSVAAVLLEAGQCGGEFFEFSTGRRITATR